MTMAKRSTRSKKPARRTAVKKPEFVNFKWEGESYTLDLTRQRVYRNWMAVEAQKSFAILGAYKQHGLSA
ncbi:MAG: hypothetical protein D6718_03275 [Acidobacteria bacterium]|nr:MAG: hypothetical protein D6718_03275 [Acidobacteriota bacterium]